MERLVNQVNKHEVYNEQGVLLLPRHTKLTKERLEWLMQHDIKLTDEDVTEFDQKKYEQVIDDTVNESRKIFAEVREQSSLSLTYIQENIVPTITQIPQEAHVIDLFLSLQAKDDYTYRHNIAVGTLASLVGQWLNLTEEEILNLSTAGFLHDVGKMRIPEIILNKPGSLTDQEFAFMQKHTVFGYEIIKDTRGTTNRQAVVALQHHERMDGSGYPYGLKRDDIDFFSRIISVVDVFHAMTSNRVYRDASPLYEVLYQMNDDTFGVLDPHITRLFIEKMMMSLINHQVLLTNGQKGHIILIHPNDPIHPLVQVGNQFFDLSKDRSLHIQSVIDE